MNKNDEKNQNIEQDSQSSDSDGEDGNEFLQKMIKEAEIKSQQQKAEKIQKAKDDEAKKNELGPDGKKKKKTLQLKSKSFKPEDKIPELSEEEQFYQNLQQSMTEAGYDQSQITQYIDHIKRQNEIESQQENQGFDFNRFVSKKKKEKKIDDIKIKKPKLIKEQKPQIIEVKQTRIIASELQKMNFDRTKYDTVDEQRQPLNIVFIGHVDAGKSTICGQVLLLSNHVDLNELKRYELEAKEKNRDSWYLAYIMDQGEEERNKGKTIEVGKAHFETKNKRFTILDAPGHKNYVPNMIAGTAQADIGCLVISAKMGEFESGFEKGGQTREHALLAKSIGISHLVILINKMDDINWDRERYLHIIQTLKTFLQEAGYDVEKNINWVPIAGLTGDNMLLPSKDKNADWYKGDTFFTILDEISLERKDPDAQLRISVLDKIRDQGLYLTGKIEQGSIKVDYICQLMPSRKNFTIQQILNSKDQSVYYAKPGENVKIKVKGLEDDDVSRGQIICSLGEPCHITNEVEAEVQILQLPDHKSILTTGYMCIMHLHCAIEEVSISNIVCSIENGKKDPKCSFLKSNTTAILRISCEKALCLEKYADNKNLGSFTLRDEGLTIGLGKVLRLKPVKAAQIQMVMEQKQEVPKQKTEVQQQIEETNQSPF